MWIHFTTPTSITRDFVPKSVETIIQANKSVQNLSSELHSNSYKLTTSNVMARLSDDKASLH